MSKHVDNCDGERLGVLIDSFDYAEALALLKRMPKKFS